MYYPEELIEEIRIQNDIVDVISSYVQLNKKGSTYFGLCPFHNEKTPSFSVSSDKQMYYCFGCGAGGNVYTFVMEYENFSFVEAVKFLADRVHITLPTVQVSDEVKKRMDMKHQLVEINKAAARYFYYQLKSEKGKVAFDYLQNRGISEEILKKFGLGYSNIFRNDLYRYLSKKFDDRVLSLSGLFVPEKSNPKEYFDRFWNRVMFPIFDVHNRIIGFGGRVLGDFNPKYLNSPETKLFDKRRNLYGLNLARSSRKENIIIVEGYMDVISLFQSGITNVVASLGTAFTSEQASLIKRYTDNVVISYDSDSAGIKAALRAIPILKAKGLSVRVLRVKGYKDPDEFIKNKGKEAFEDLIANATSGFMFEVEEMNKNYNLDDPESKTKFHKQVAYKILELESEIERDNYIDALAKKYNTKKSLLEKLVAETGKNTGIVSPRQEIKNNREKNKNSEDGIILAQKSILTLIANNEDIYKIVKKHLKVTDFLDDFYRNVAKEVYQAYEKNNKVEYAVIINKFIELDEQKKVAGIFNINIVFENKMQLEKIINETVKLIKAASIDASSRTVNDTNELQKLILAKRELQGLHISLKDG
ncbi:DNA primase [Vallitalea longa]|uniref:DNA primase n=1 Tax=Vallitalea longa TaxID=2936439 RepID=A0A9W5YBP7_9FIRM|nr:DNA primase [Vallitalea longa]GKX31042.1 DNA primase [Vallitalea longa]